MSENWKIQVSPKLADGTLINLRAETPEQAEHILEWAISHAPKIQEAIAAFGGVSNVGKVFPGSQVQQDGPSWSQQGSQQQAQAAPPQGGPSCVHGARVFKSGTSKAGKPYKMWACPSQNRQAQCDPEWVRD